MTGNPCFVNVGHSSLIIPLTVSDPLRLSKPVGTILPQNLFALHPDRTNKIKLNSEHPYRNLPG